MAADHRDVTQFRAKHREFQFIWASPPCTEFSKGSMPWHRKKLPVNWSPDLSLVFAAQRVIRECSPDFWALENVRGALPWICPILGPPVARVGACYLWGVLPDGISWPTVAHHKGMHRSAALRSLIPRPISDTLASALTRALAA